MADERHFNWTNLNWNEPTRADHFETSLLIGPSVTCEENKKQDGRFPEDAEAIVIFHGTINDHPQYLDNSNT